MPQSVPRLWARMEQRQSSGLVSNRKALVNEFEISGGGDGSDKFCLKTPISEHAEEGTGICGGLNQDLRSVTDRVS